ncbi:SRPBCC family protein [Planctomycetes bacterium K23_9]|uniref:Polyketide cyclase / dehydrase and lipid transport n=1 Tax=Stieleria marina TaxID=1930275 RepID=A0A517NME1_9BACT|nr:Polyketide cyclase / dehydrase and lipid transport [Planctomycetes bacterium K23_9]
MRTQLSVIIDRPAEEVFDYTLNHADQWSKSIVSDEVIEEKNGGGVGTTFRMVTEENGQEMIFRGEVTRWNRPSVARSFLKGDAFDIDVEYRFENMGYRTEVTQESRVLPKSIALKVVFLTAGWLFKGIGRRALQKDFETLKQQLETT